MQGLVDFLSFKTLVSPYVLVVFYYLGALGLPIGSWLFASWINSKYWMASEAHEGGTVIVKSAIRGRYRVLFYSLFMFLFLSMELIWRMLFEFILVYFQMRDALFELVIR